jgi:hypothetical protein
MNEDLPVLAELEHRLIAGCYGDGGRAGGRARWLRWPLAAIGPLVTAAGVAIAVVVLSAGKPAARSDALQKALYRAADAAAAQSQPAFGPGEFWYTRALVDTTGPGLHVLTRQEAWFGWNGVTRVRSPQPRPNFSGQETITVGYPYFGPSGATIGLPQALIPNQRLATLPTDIAGLRAAIDAGQAALTRQENALKIKVRRTPGSSEMQLVARSHLTPAQQRAYDLIGTAGALLAAPVSPAVRAGLFRLLATIPGLRFQHSVRDLLGRSGDSVSIGRGNQSTTLLFDPGTGRLLSYSLSHFLTETIVAQGFTTSIQSIPAGLRPVGGHAPRFLIAKVMPRTGTPFTRFSLVQSIRITKADQGPFSSDELEGPTTTNCKAELFPGPNPRMNGGARTTALGKRAFRYAFGPESIGRRVWCAGTYQLRVMGLNGASATAYFDVK